ncbi:Glutamine synthetase [Hordeum vulgare]|nr:Glutamine synthetase [Hordeum vulgare]
MLLLLMRSCVVPELGDEGDAQPSPPHTMVHISVEVLVAPSKFVLPMAMATDRQLEDAMAMFFYCAQMDTWPKEVVEPSDQRFGIKRDADKENGMTHANGASGIQCK